MKIGIIGGGVVGQALGAGFVKSGYQVTIGIRTPSAEEIAKPRAQGTPLSEWVRLTGAPVTTMPEAAAWADVVINATAGDVSVAALTLAGADNLAGKVVIDAANPLDFSRGFPPALMAGFTGYTSLGEQLQAAFPLAHVVKAFNTVGHAVMATPALLPGDHDLFLAGNDAAAKATVTSLARDLGWQHVVDMGDITAARATETIVLVWLQIMVATGGSHHNLHVQR